MLFITDSEFERVVSRARNRMLARKFFENGDVVRVHIEHDAHGYSIVGNVLVNNQLYTPHIHVNDSSKIISDRCNCIFSDEYTSCAHTGALILAVQDLSPDHFPFDYQSNYEAVRAKRLQEQKDYQLQLRKKWEDERRQALESVAMDLTDTIRNEMVQSFDIRDTSLPVTLHIFQETGLGTRGLLRFKVGRKKFYYIKNLAEMVRDTENHRIHEYGKGFTWISHYEDLDSPSMVIYDFISRSIALLHSDDYYNPPQYLKITDENIDAFGELLSTIPAAYSDIIYREDSYQPVFEVKEDDHDMILTYKDDHHFYYGKQDIYEIKDHELIRYVLDKAGILSRLLKHIMENDDVLYIPQNKKGDFYRFILSPIKNMIVLENFKDEGLSQEEDKIEIYGDIDEDEVAVLDVYGLFNEAKVNMLTSPDHPHSARLDLILNYLRSFQPDEDDKHFYLDTHHEETMDFLNDGIAFLNTYADIYVSDNLKKIGTRAKMHVSVGISVKNDLLSIDVDSLDIPKEELAQVMNSYRKKKKYHKLKNGEMLYIQSDELNELSDMMDHYHLMSKDLKDGHIDMNLNRAYALEHSADNMQYLKVERSQSFEEILHRLKDYKAHRYPLSEHYEPVLRDYQKEGYQWLSTMSDLHFGGILADDMGLGKTLQMIALLENHSEHLSIVVCPSSLVLNWLDEFNKFTSSLKAVCIMGGVKERRELIKNYQSFDVLITSYDYLRRDIDHYEEIDFDYVVLDEAQYIKNQNTKNAVSVKRLQGKHRFALTGTPIENSLAELWSIFDFLNKDYLFNYSFFKKEYESPIIREQDEEKQKELKNLISPFVLRRTKKEVLKELPDKVENTITIDFDPEERKMYLAHLAQANKELNLLDASSDRIQILALLTRLRQICCEPRMLFEDIDHISSKMQGCLDIIETYKENNKKVIVFSSFATVLNLLSEELHERGIEYHMLTGATPKIKRKEMVDAFQVDTSTVFLISLKAGGTGLNLTSAEGVIHFDPWWNMSAQSQATDRAHRIGQKNTVFVYKLIMADSIEEKIQKLQTAKKDLADTFVEGNEGKITSMSSDEIMSLFQ